MTVFCFIVLTGMKITGNYTNNIVNTLYSNKITKPLMQEGNRTCFSKQYSNAISNQQKAFILSRPKLDKVSDACKFFGVDNVTNVFKQLKNQCILTDLKTKELGINKSFMHGTCINFANKDTLIKAKDRIWNGYTREKNGLATVHSGIEELRKNGVARITLYGKLYGKFGKVGSHTIGLVYDNKSNNLYIMDSLGENLPTIKKHHKILKSLFTADSAKSQDKAFNDIIISTKKQQKYNQYCCNNWTFANIEALKNALNKGEVISDSNSLNKILPNDINKVLEEQQKFVQKNISKTTVSQ